MVFGAAGVGTSGELSSRLPNSIEDRDFGCRQNEQDKISVRIALRIPKPFQVRAAVFRQRYVAHVDRSGRILANLNGVDRKVLVAIETSIIASTSGGLL